MDNQNNTTVIGTLTEGCVLTKESLRKLKKLLPPDAEADLARQFDISKHYVRKVLLGYYLENDNPRLDVIEAATVMAIKYKTELNGKVATISKQIEAL